MSPVFAVDLGNRSRDLFVANNEKEAEDLVAPMTKLEVERGVVMRGAMSASITSLARWVSSTRSIRLSQRGGGRRRLGPLPNHTRRQRLHHLARGK